MLTTIARAKTFLRIDQSDETQDTELELFLPVASSAIETYCNRTFGRGDYEQEILPNCRTVIQLRNYPIIAVASIDHDDKPVTRYKVHKDRGTVSRHSWPSEIVVHYTGGYILPEDDSEETPSDLPKEIEYACILLYQHLQRQPGVTSERVGDLAITYGAESGSGLPPAVRALVGPYRNVNL